MSDALLTKILEGIEGLRADLKKSGGASAGGASSGGASSGGATSPRTPAPDKTAADKAAAAAAKVAADKKAAAAATNKPAAGPAAGTKAPGGKRTIEQVREMIRKVAADPNLGKQSAKDVLADDGGGVEKVLDLKPENYDKVYEACEVLLKGEGTKAAASEPEDDLM